MLTEVSVTSGVRSFWDSLASEVAGYKGTMADSDSRGSEKPEGSESGLEELEALFDKMTQKMIQEMKQDFSEIKQDIRAVVVQLDQSREEFREERVAARRRCEGSTEVVRSRVEEEVVAAQSPVSDQQLFGGTGHCELRVSVADMEEPCLLGSRLLVWECSV